MFRKKKLVIAIQHATAEMVRRSHWNDVAKKIEEEKRERQKK